MNSTSAHSKHQIHKLFPATSPMFLAPWLASGSAPGDLEKGRTLMEIYVDLSDVLN